MLRKFYSFNTDSQGMRDAMRVFLKENNIYYELSSRFDGWHFEVLCSDEEVDGVESWLESVDEEGRACA